MHTSPDQDADRWFHHYGLSGLVRIADSDTTLYQQFSLQQGSVAQLAHPRVWWPWIRTAVLRGFGAGVAGPNWRQLTGVFVIHRGHILASLRHRNSATRPDYAALVHGLKLGATIR